jgi:hypothetical protein
MTAPQKPTSAQPKLGCRGLGCLLIFSLVFGWLVIEVFMRVGFDSLPPGVQANIQGVQRVPWSAERLVPPFPYIIDDRLQARIPPGLRNYPIHWSDARFNFDTNTIWEGHLLGFRVAGPPTYPLDVLAVGDSFTFCWVKLEDCWVSKLAATGLSTSNVGLAGTGPGGQLALLKEIAPPMKPRLIVWQWYVNDNSDDYDLARLQNAVDELSKGPLPDPARELTGLARYSALVALFAANSGGVQPESPYKHFQLATVNGRSVSVRTNEYPHIHGLQYESTQYGLGQNKAHHAAGQALAKQLGAQMLIVLLPAKEEAYADQLASLLDSAYLADLAESRLQLLAQCQAQNWHCIDALPALRAAAAAGENAYYGFDSHLNAEGNAILAELVANYIAEAGLLSQ